MQASLDLPALYRQILNDAAVATVTPPGDDMALWACPEVGSAGVNPNEVLVSSDCLDGQVWIESYRGLPVHGGSSGHFVHPPHQRFQAGKASQPRLFRLDSPRHRGNTSTDCATEPDRQQSDTGAQAASAPPCCGSGRLAH
jgi:hypothetical protein